MILGLELWLSWPDWIKYLYLGVVWMFTISAAGIVLARIGIKPMWALVVVVPALQVLAYWALAYKRDWPLERLAAGKACQPAGIASS